MVQTIALASKIRISQLRIPNKLSYSCFLFVVGFELKIYFHSNNVFRIENKEASKIIQDNMQDWGDSKDICTIKPSIDFCLN